MQAQNKKNIDRMELDCEIENEISQQVSKLIELSDEFWRTDLEKALAYSQEAYAISIKNNYKYGQMFSMLNLIDIYIDKSDYKKGLKYALEVLNIANEDDEIHIRARALHDLGSIYRDFGDYKKSSEYLFESIKLVEQLNDSIGIKSVLTSIAIIFAMQDKYDKAFDYDYRAYTIAKALNDSSSIARGLNNIGDVYLYKGEIQKAIEYFNQALEINRVMNNQVFLCYNYMNLAICYQKLEKKKDALKYFYKSIELGQANSNQKIIGKSYFYLSQFFKEDQNLDESKVYAEKAFKICKENGFKGDLNKVADLLFRIYLMENDSSKALQYLMFQQEINDSLTSTNNLTELLELQYEYEKDTQIANYERQKKRLIEIIVFVCLIFSLILFILIIIHLRLKSKDEKIKKKKLEDELMFKKKELTANMMSIIRKNKDLVSMASKLKAIKSNAVKDETKSAIKRIIWELNKIDNDVNWTEFDLRFKEVHTNFYNTLIKKFPNLSPNDLRLCALLRLNLTTKEISELTGQIPKTIEIARTRLRKKLNLCYTKINIITFLSQL